MAHDTDKTDLYGGIALGAASLAALVIADELADANEALRLERSGAHDAATGTAVDAAANGIHGLAQRVEAIAARLETS